MITALVETGAEVNALSQNGFTPLLLAAQVNQNPDVIVALMKAGADVTIHRKSLTPLIAASAYNQNPEVITTLLKFGGNVNARTEDGGTPLMAAAAFNQNPEVIATLLKAGADAKASSSVRDQIRPKSAAYPRSLRRPPGNCEHYWT